ncbi:hypothetical protein N0V90_013178 [Kalmusia sp. IMI 367209]|nr:hypothetical protein N0V90_013178 [Kalmusia sp. IMI 367209]
MDISSTEAIFESASRLIRDIAAGILDQDAGGFGSFTPAVYDTAWLAMIIKSTGDQNQELLFPQCFDYLIQEQRDDGSWESYGSQIDGILNSLAALLALVKHKQRHFCSPAERLLLSPRIENAKVAILRLLKDWDVRETCHVGFEILVPSLLERLSSHHIELHDFPGRILLYQLYQKKLNQFPFDLLYGKTQTTLLHSLEAFVGRVDFQRLSHHLTGGSMLGSPASTAAYLMEIREWDTRAENYLRQVEQRWFSNSKQIGVPSAFPCTVFESSWALSTLLAHGIDKECLPQEDLQVIVDFLSLTLNGQSGIVGFAPGFLADADDTAVTLLVLRQFDMNVSFKGLLETFSSAQNFRTYAHESSPSFSANCNVLIALLHAPDLNAHAPYIRLAIDYLVTLAEEGLLKDKWNIATTYSWMLLIRALVAVTRAWDEGRLTELSQNMREFRIPAVICQTLARLLRGQTDDGSWGASVDRTAYGVLALAHAIKLPWPDHMKEILATAIALGRDFLRQLTRDDIQRPSYVWIEKVTYASPILSRVYALAAMQSPTSPLPWTDKIQAMFDFYSDRLSPMMKLISKTPLFAENFTVSPSLIKEESALYLKRLMAESVCSEIFPVRKSASNKYKTIIPLTWVGCNHHNGFAMGPKQMWIMMILSDLIYQSDEYMETTVGTMSCEDQETLETFIREQCGCHASNGIDPVNGTSKSPPRSLPPIEEAKGVLHAFIFYVLQQPSLLSRPKWQKHVANELCGFLLAHMRHVRDNTRFSDQGLLTGQVPNGNGSAIDTFHDPRIAYFEWIHTLAIDDTSCPFAFTVFQALIEDTGPPPTPYARMYNDYGSLARDQEEKNLNSVNFPEFAGLGMKEAKEQLMEMAEFERQGVKRTLDTLKLVVMADVWRQVKAFVDVTDLYGQIYVIKDLTNRIK